MCWVTGRRDMTKRCSLSYRGLRTGKSHSVFQGMARREKQRQCHQRQAGRLRHIFHGLGEAVDLHFPAIDHFVHDAGVCDQTAAPIGTEKMKRPAGSGRFCRRFVRPSVNTVRDGAVCRLLSCRFRPRPGTPVSCDVETPECPRQRWSAQQRLQTSRWTGQCVPPVRPWRDFQADT